MFYFTEFEDDAGKIQSRNFENSLPKARSHARYLSAKDHDLLVYVIADDGSERVGAECYAYGRRDSADGRML